MKRFISILFVLTLVMAVAVPALAADDTVTVTVKTDVTGELRIGDTFNVTLSVNNSNANRMVAAIQLSLTGMDGLEAGKQTWLGNGLGSFANNNVSYFNTDGLEGNADFITFPVTVTDSAIVRTQTISVEIETIADLDDVEFVTSKQGADITITHDHNMVKNDQKSTAATCGKAGEDYYECNAGNGCTKFEKKPVPATGKHTYSWTHDNAEHWQVCSVCGDTTDKVAHDQNNVKANEDGETHTITCSVCGYSDSSAKHVLGEWEHNDTDHYKKCSVCGAEVEKAAHTKKYTANADGTTHKVECEVCQTVLVASEEHQGEWITDNDVACGERAKQTRTCTLCNAVEVKENEFVEHKWDAGEVTKEATCTEPGEKVYKCTNPKCPGEDGTKPAEKKEVLPALGHDYTGEEYTEKCVDPTYLKAGVKATKCVRFNECEAWEEEPIDKLELVLGDNLNITVEAKPEFVNNKAVMDELKDTIATAVQTIADGGTPSTIKTDFIDAVQKSLDVNGGDVNITVTVSFTGVTDPSALPGRMQQDAAGMTFEAGWKLGISATVSNTKAPDKAATVDDAMNTLPVPAEYALSKPEYAAPVPIGVQFEGDDSICSSYPAVKSDGAFVMEAYNAGYYALYTTTDLSWAEIVFDQTSVFNGSAVKPNVKVFVNGVELDPKYYSISYKDNDKVGTGEFSIQLTEEGSKLGFTLDEPIVKDFEITAAPVTPTPKPAEKDKSQSDVPATGDETNVVLYAAVMVLCTAALALVLLRKKSSR